MSQVKLVTKNAATGQVMGERVLKTKLGSKAATLRMKLLPDELLQLVDEETGLGPGRILIERVGDDLHLSFYDRSIDASDVIVESYYSGSTGLTHQGRLVGQAPNGSLVSYTNELVQAANSAGAVQISQVLGSQAINFANPVAAWGIVGNAPPAFVAGALVGGVIGLGERDSDSDSDSDSDVADLLKAAKAAANVANATAYEARVATESANAAREAAQLDPSPAKIAAAEAAQTAATDGARVATAAATAAQAALDAYTTAATASNVPLADTTSVSAAIHAAATAATAAKTAAIASEAATDTKIDALFNALTGLAEAANNAAAAANDAAQKVADARSVALNAPSESNLQYFIAAKTTALAAAAFADNAASVAKGAQQAYIDAAKAGNEALGDSSATGYAVAAANGAATAARNAANNGDTSITVYVTAGQLIEGHQLEAKIYKDDGSLYGAPVYLIDGAFKLTKPGGYSGALLIVVSDTSGSDKDYLDEASGSPKSLATQLRAAISVDGPGAYSANVTPLTELAVRKMNVNGFKAPSVGVLQVVNKATSDAFGVDDVVGVRPLTIDRAEFDPKNLGPDAVYGLMLAVLSAVDMRTGGVDATLDALSAEIKDANLSDIGRQLLTVSVYENFDDPVDDSVNDFHGRDVDLIPLVKSNVDLVGVPIDSIQGRDAVEKFAKESLKAIVVPGAVQSTIADFAIAKITNVDSRNLAAIKSVLSSGGVNVGDREGVQSIVDSYNVVLNAAAGRESPTLVS